MQKKIINKKINQGTKHENNYNMMINEEVIPYYYYFFVAFLFFIILFFVFFLKGNCSNQVRFNNLV